ncbi:ewing's tumor-associated antigen 1 homolog isoform X1 [Oncorhynchus keta]|uniref:ewing's tumor-associated antigen 1 homolog isoform X1 n=1 Tax=Oncorhynchus keta TaxID=8018 RepID=UPI00227BF0DB|nr:ewing's tumor-associated antigen 1 homolog isoform X1 [Oncorhynchus keta]
MPNPRKHDHNTGSNEIWSHGSTCSQKRLRTNKSGKSQKLTPQSSPSVRKSPHTRSKDLETPKRRARGRYTGLNNTADSPGDGDILQDIIWDPASPPPAGSGEGPGNTRVVEISDIVNRIAPKDAQHVSVDSPLLQWIGDSAVPCTPEVRPPKARKKSTRKSSVEDLMQLARQFDINMHQQDREKRSAEHPNNTINNNRYGEEPKGPTMSSSAQKVEAELNALFDGPTQRVTGRLSQGSTASTCSQEVKVQVGVSHLTADDLVKESEVKPGGGSTSGSSARTGKEEKGQWNATTTVAKDEDFDWEDDDLLSDPIVLEMTQNPDGLKTLSPKPSSSSTHLQPSNRGGLTGPCPKPKPNSRSTFLLEPNLCFQVNMAPTTKEALRPFLTVGAAQPERPRPGVSASVGSRGPSRDSAEGKADGVSTATTPTSRGTTAPDSPFKDLSEEDLQSLFDSESLWNDDEGDDDELLYQVCDDVERISNSQPLSEDASVTTDTTEVRFQESKPKAPPSAPLAATREGTVTMDRAVGGSSSKQPTTCTSGRSNSVREGTVTMDRAVGGPGSKQPTTCTSGRSNSAPGDGSSTPVHFQRWNIPAKAGNVWVGHHTVTSQSHPGSGEGLGKFTQLKGAPGWGTFGLGSLGVRTFQAENSKSVMPRTVSARTLPNSNSHHASSFKRHLSDSAAVGNKVFVNSQLTGRCTEEEIERKKQEAIARRRTRETSLKAGALPL